MSHAITMPALSDTMSNGRLVKWTKKPGDAIKKGDVIAEIETDKAVMDVEAFEDGYLSGPLTAEGTEVPVGEVIGYIADRREGRHESCGGDVLRHRRLRPTAKRQRKPPSQHRRFRLFWPPRWDRCIPLARQERVVRRLRAPLLKPRPQRPPQIRRRRRWRRGRRIALNAPPACARPSPAT